MSKRELEIPTESSIRDSEQIEDSSKINAQLPVGEPTAKRHKGVENIGADDDVDNGECDDCSKRVKRKLALVIGYVGLGYRGLMINYEIEEASKLKSVEHVLRGALVRAGLVTTVNAERLEQKIGWARSSRTDAGVSAVRLIISARILVRRDGLDDDDEHLPNVVEELNRELPDDIRCFSAIKVPRSFDAKRACSWREYEYLLPAEMVRPVASSGKDSVEDMTAALRKSMEIFLGTHSFHNYSRVKVSDLQWKSNQEKTGNDAAKDESTEGGKRGSADGKGKKNKTKGKGKGKGKKGKHKNIGKNEDAADVAAAEVEAIQNQPNDEVVSALCKSKANGVAPAAQDAVAAVGESGVAPSESKGPCQTRSEQDAFDPVWMDLCAKDPSTGRFRERPAEVFKHTNTTMWMCAVDPVLDGTFFRIRLRGQFFLYNQIRLMVGTAAAVARGTMPEELQRIALDVPVQMHMPLAPPTGLFQRNSGFSMLDARAGFAAMDSEQAKLAMLPEGGFCLLDKKGVEAANAFTLKVEDEVAKCWREGSDVGQWLEKLESVRLLPEDVTAELRSMAETHRTEQAQQWKQQAQAEMRRRLEGRSEDVLPRRFATALLVRFGMIPGWRPTYVQKALSRRLRAWLENPNTRPGGLPADPGVDELLDYAASVGVDVLADEGASGESCVQ